MRSEGEGAEWDGDYAGAAAGGQGRRLRHPRLVARKTLTPTLSQGAREEEVGGWRGWGGSLMGVAGGVEMGGLARNKSFFQETLEVPGGAFPTVLGVRRGRMWVSGCGGDRGAVGRAQHERAARGARGVLPGPGRRRREAGGWGGAVWPARRVRGADGGGRGGVQGRGKQAAQGSESEEREAEAWEARGVVRQAQHARWGEEQ